MEEWRDVVGYEGCYEVSNLGRVRSGKGLLTPKVSKGYSRIELWKGNRRRSYQLHRLVAMAFVPNPENKPEVNHIDLDKSNCCASNLEWVSGKENRAHATDHGAGQSQDIPVLMDDAIRFESIAAAARHIGVVSSRVARVVHGKRKSIHGHRFDRI